MIVAVPVNKLTWRMHLIKNDLRIDENWKSWPFSQSSEHDSV